MVVTVSTRVHQAQPISLYGPAAGGRARWEWDKEEDFVSKVFIASMHAYIMFFTSAGKVYWLKVHEIPEAGRAAKGKAIVNLLSSRRGSRSPRSFPSRSSSRGSSSSWRPPMGHQEDGPHEYSRPRAGGIIGLD